MINNVLWSFYLVAWVVYKGSISCGSTQKPRTKWLLHQRATQASLARSRAGFERTGWVWPGLQALAKLNQFSKFAPQARGKTSKAPFELPCSG